MPRDVFFVHGFEKRSPRHHRLAQAREARKWAAARGVTLEVGPLEEAAPGYARWRLWGSEDVRFHLFDWSDVVAERMRAPWWRVMWQSVGALFRALRQGVFGKVRRRDRAMWAMQCVGFGPLVVSLLLAVCALFVPWLWLPATVALLLTVWTIAAGPRSPVRYVLDIAWGARRLALRDHTVLEARRAELAARIAAAEGEVLVVGHSLGAVIAMDAAAAADRGQVTLVTVGQSIPLVSLQREAGWARAGMRALNAPWIDISAGRDVLGFDGYDPSGGKAACYPARLSRSVPAERLKRLRWRGYATHLLYFAAAERGDAPWDWFAVLTGADTALERMAGETKKNGAGTRRWPL